MTELQRSTPGAYYILLIHRPFHLGHDEIKSLIRFRYWSLHNLNPPPLLNLNPWTGQTQDFPPVPARSQWALAVTKELTAGKASENIWMGINHMSWSFPSYNITWVHQLSVTICTEHRWNAPPLHNCLDLPYLLDVKVRQGSSVNYGTLAIPLPLSYTS